jgi:hypothetical protein
MCIDVINKSSDTKGDIHKPMRAVVCMYVKPNEQVGIFIVASCLTEQIQKSLNVLKDLT